MAEIRNAVDKVEASTDNFKVKERKVEAETARQEIQAITE